MNASQPLDCLQGHHIATLKQSVQKGHGEGVCNVR